MILQSLLAVSQTHAIVVVLSDSRLLSVCAAPDLKRFADDGIVLAGSVKPGGDMAIVMDETP
jgi:hypothetical protein